MKKTQVIIILLMIIALSQFTSGVSATKLKMIEYCNDDSYGCNIFRFEYSPDGSEIALTYFNEEELSRILDSDYNLIKTLHSESSDGTAGNLCWSSDGTMLAFIGWIDGEAWDDIYIFDTTTGETVLEKKGWMFDEAKGKSSLTFNNNGTLLAVGGGTSIDQGLIEIFDVNTGSQLHSIYVDDRFSQNETFITSIIFTANCEYLIAGDMNGAVIIWETDEWTKIEQFQAHNDRITSIALNKSGDYFATASLDTTVKIWEVSSWEKVQTLSENKFGVYSIDWSKDGKMLASGSQSDDFDNPVGGEVIIWDTSQWNKVAVHQEEGGIGLSKVDWNPAKDQLAVGTTDSELKIFIVSGSGDGDTGSETLILISIILITVIIVVLIVMLLRKGRKYT